MTNPSSAQRVQAVSVVGLGKLGAPAAACYAQKGYRVIGVDSNADTVRLVRDGRAPVAEPGLVEMIRANRERLSATSDYAEAVLDSDITFIVVPTPSDAEGGSRCATCWPRAKRSGRPCAGSRPTIWWP